MKPVPPPDIFTKRCVIVSRLCDPGRKDYGSVVAADRRGLLAHPIEFYLLELRSQRYMVLTQSRIQQLTEDRYKETLSHYDREL
jgi:hypothetical protein